MMIEYALHPLWYYLASFPIEVETGVDVEGVVGVKCASGDACEDRFVMGAGPC